MKKLFVVITTLYVTAVYANQTSIEHIATYDFRTTSYTVDKNYEVKAGETLTIPAGSRVYFAPLTGIDVKGELLITGTADRPVILTSTKAMTNQGAAFDWRGLRLFPASSAELTYAVISFASFGIQSCCDNIGLKNVTFYGNGNHIQLGDRKIFVRDREPVHYERAAIVRPVASAAETNGRKTNGKASGEQTTTQPPTFVEPVPLPAQIEPQSTATAQPAQTETQVETQPVRQIEQPPTPVEQSTVRSEPQPQLIAKHEPPPEAQVQPAPTVKESDQRPPKQKRSKKKQADADTIPVTVATVIVPDTITPITTKGMTYEEVKKKSGFWANVKPHQYVIAGASVASITGGILFFVAANKSVDRYNNYEPGNPDFDNATNKQRSENFKTLKGDISANRGMGIGLTGLGVLGGAYLTYTFVF